MPKPPLDARCDRSDADRHELVGPRVRVFVDRGDEDAFAAKDLIETPELRLGGREDNRVAARRRRA